MTCCGLPRQSFSFNSVRKTSDSVTMAASHLLPILPFGKQRIAKTCDFIGFMRGEGLPFTMIGQQRVLDDVQRFASGLKLGFESRAGLNALPPAPEAIKPLCEITGHPHHCANSPGRSIPCGDQAFDLIRVSY